MFKVLAAICLLVVIAATIVLFGWQKVLVVFAIIITSITGIVAVLSVLIPTYVFCKLVGWVRDLVWW